MASVDTDSLRILMHRPAVEVLPDTTLRSAAGTLADESVGVAVVRGHQTPGPGTRAVGLVSERDIVRALAEGADPDTATAGDVMTADLASASPDESISVAAARMLESEIRHLPVVDGDRVVGVVSMRDVLEALTASIP